MTVVAAGAHDFMPVCRRLRFLYLPESCLPSHHRNLPRFQAPPRIRSSGRPCRYAGTRLTSRGRGEARYWHPF